MRLDRRDIGTDDLGIRKLIGKIASIKAVSKTLWAEDNHLDWHLHAPEPRPSGNVKDFVNLLLVEGSEKQLSLGLQE